MWSQSADIEEMMVVSEMGEAWSPNIPPLITEAMISGICISIVAPIARAIGIIIENVPQLVPVENAVILDTQNIRSGINIGEILPLRIDDRYLAVPKSPIILPIKSANIIIITMGIISPIPS